MFPSTRSGRASLLPPVPWHCSGRMLTLEYRTDPEAVEELTRLEPRELIAGYWRKVAMSWRSGTTLVRNHLATMGDTGT